MYVDGILCENEIEGLSLADQPDPPDLSDVALPKNPGRYAVYLDVWLREITALEDPSIREVALGGPDTCTRTKTVWQARLSSSIDPGSSCAAALERVKVELTGNLAARAQPESNNNGPCIIPARAGYRRLENQLYRVEIHDDAGVPAFKWSRDNGSIVRHWLSTNGDTIPISSMGRDKVLSFAPGQWVELIDDKQELEGKPGTLVRLSEVDGQALTIDPDTAIGKIFEFASLKNPKIRRWDSPGLVKITGGWQELESGVQVKFDGDHHSGDYWLIPARTAVGDVEWPRQGDGSPKPQSPKGIRHHHCALALIEFDGASWRVVEDCRPVFEPLAERAIHITAVNTIDPDEPLLNDSEVPANIFVNGIKVNLDAVVASNTISQATCFVSLDLPLQPPGTGSGSVEWGFGPAAGFLPFILAGELDATTAPNEILWTPTMTSTPVTEWLNPLLNRLNQDAPRILAHFTLKGNFIWSDESAEIYLDGESFGKPRDEFEDAGLPTGDGRRGGTFEMWFWIVPSLEISDITLTPNAVPVGLPSPSSKGTVILTSQAPPEGLTVNLSSSNLSSSNTMIAQVPATLLVSGGNSATFDITTSAVGDAEIKASLPGSAKSKTLRVIGINSLTLEPGTVNVGDPSTATVTLTDVAPDGLRVAITSTSRASVASGVLVPAGLNSVSFTVTANKTPNSPGSATITVSVGTSTQQKTLDILTPG
jgi:hypothetical protein